MAWAAIEQSRWSVILQPVTRASILVIEYWNLAIWLFCRTVQEGVSREVRLPEGYASEENANSSPGRSNSFTYRGAELHAAQTHSSQFPPRQKPHLGFALVRRRQRRRR